VAYGIEGDDVWVESYTRLALLLLLETRKTCRERPTCMLSDFPARPLPRPVPQERTITRGGRTNCRWSHRHTVRTHGKAHPRTDPGVAKTGGLRGEAGRMRPTLTTRSGQTQTTRAARRGTPLQDTAHVCKGGSAAPASALHRRWTAKLIKLPSLTTPHLSRRSSNDLKGTNNIIREL